MVLDISENGWQIAEKLFVLLDTEQQKELAWYVLGRKRQGDILPVIPCSVSAPFYPQADTGKALTEILAGDLFFCLEERRVCVRGQAIGLTTKEFDALHLLIINRKRVMTFEAISYHVWGEDYIDVTTQAIHNLMSRLRQKLQAEPDVLEYIISVRGVGYKFDF